MLLEEVILAPGTTASRPAASSVPVGTLFVATDSSPADQTYRSNGTSWDLYAPGTGGSGITQLTGDVTAGPGSGSQAATLATSGVTAGTYGDASHVPVVTVDAKGRATTVTTVAIPAGAGGVTGPVSAVSGDLASYSGTTGKVIADSGIAAANVPLLNASNVFSTVNTFSGLGTTPLNATQLTSGTVALARMPTSGNAAQFLNGAGAFAFPSATYATDTTTGTVNNWAPTWLAGHTFLLWMGTADLTVTGMAGGVAGQQLVFCNWGSGGNLYFPHNSTGSVIGNRFTNATTSGPTPVAAGGTAIYQSNGSTWRLIAHEQGAWITPAFNAANYTGGSGMTWTVAAGNVNTDKYRLSGRTLSFAMYLSATTLGGTAVNAIYRATYGYATPNNSIAGIAAATDAGVAITPYMNGVGATIGIVYNALGQSYTLGAFTLFAAGSVEVT